MSIRADITKVAVHSIASIRLGPIEFHVGPSRTVAWRDVIITDEGGKVSKIELFASEADTDTLTARLRVVGDPPVEEPWIEPPPEPLKASDYIPEGDAC